MFSKNNHTNKCSNINALPYVIYLFICILLFNTQAIGAKYYIDFLNGDNSNSGLDTNAAWKHCPGDNKADANPSKTTLRFGDTLVFKGGSQYIGGIIIKWSGVADHPIVYDGNSSGTWGKGSAIIDGNNTHVSSSCAFSIASKQYITIKGFVLQNYSGISSGGIAIESSRYISVIKCKVWNIGDWSLADPQCSTGKCDNSYLNGGAGEGVGISEYKSSDILFDSLEITKVTTIGISIKGVGINKTVRNCFIHDFMIFGIDIDPADAGSLMENLSIHDNRIANFYSYTGDYWTSTVDGKVNIGNPDGSLPHMDGLFFRNSGHGIYKNARIYNNSFYNNVKFISGSGQNTMFYISQLGRVGAIDDTVYVYNNLFQGCYMGTVFRMTNLDHGTIFACNNTFYLRQSSAITFDCNSGVGSDGTKLYFKNNIIVMDTGSGSSTAINLDSSEYITSKIYSDYNLYVINAKNVLFTTIGSKGNWYSTLSSWKAAHGLDQHSIQVSSNNLKLVSPRAIVYSDSSDLHIASGSSAYGAGVNLGAPFNIDRDNNIRGIDGKWSIGAYEGKPSDIKRLQPSHIHIENSKK
jgi:hypothetical protein